MPVHRKRERAGRDHHVLEVEVANGFFADLDADASLADEPGGALDDGDTGGFQKARDAADELVHRGGAARLKLSEVAGARMRRREQSQLLARDASFIETDPSDAASLDQRHLAAIL